MRLGTWKLKISSFFAFLGVLALMLTACGGSTGATGPSDKASNQTFKFVWGTGGSSPDIPTMDPASAQDSASIPIVGLVWDGLVVLDSNLKVIPWAAQKIDAAADGLSYTFTLRNNLKFADGNPIHASDFAYSIDRSLNPCVGSVTASYFIQAHLKDAGAYNGATCTNGQATGAVTTVVGDSVIADDSANTLKLVLDQPAGYFLAALTYSTSYAVEKSLLAGASDLGKDGTWVDKAIGCKGTSGMFCISVWDHQGNLNLKPNPNWWGKKPTLQEIDFKLFSNSDTAYNSYLSDPSFAYSDGIPTDQLAAAKGQPDYREGPQLAFFGVDFNWNIKPFNNKDARLALCEAINRDQMSTSVYEGTRPPSWHIVPQGMPGYNANLQGPEGTPTAGDLTKAKAHWAAYKATLNGASIPPIAIAFNFASATNKLLAEFLQAEWNAAFPDAHVTIDQRPWAQLLDLENAKNLQLFRFGWIADYPDAQDFLTLLYSKTSIYNNQNADVPAADALMSQADAIVDASKQDQRNQLYNQAEQDLVNEVAFCPTTGGLSYNRIQPWIKRTDGVKFGDTAQGFPALDAWQTAYIANH